MRQCRGIGKTVVCRRDLDVGVSDRGVGEPVMLLHGSSPGFASFHGGFASFNGGWRVPTDQRVDTEPRRQTVLDYAAIAATSSLEPREQEGIPPTSS
jgi:hypothetical protein